MIPLFECRTGVPGLGAGTGRAVQIIVNLHFDGDIPGGADAGTAGRGGGVSLRSRRGADPDGVRPRRGVEGDVRRLLAGTFRTDGRALHRVRPGARLRPVRRRQEARGRDAFVPGVAGHHPPGGRSRRPAGEGDGPRPGQPQERAGAEADRGEGRRDVRRVDRLRPRGAQGRAEDGGGVVERQHRPGAGDGRDRRPVRRAGGRRRRRRAAPARQARPRHVPRGRAGAGRRGGAGGGLRGRARGRAGGPGRRVRLRGGSQPGRRRAREGAGRARRRRGGRRPLRAISACAPTSTRASRTGCRART